MKKLTKYLLMAGFLFAAAACGNEVVEKETEIKSAKDFYYQSLKDEKNSLASYELNSKLVVAGEEFTVSWELIVKDGIESNVTLGEVKDGKYPVTILFDDEHSLVDTHYTLKCTITNQYNDTETFELNRVVPEYKFAGHDEWVAACAANDKTVVNIKAFVIGAVDAASSSFTSMYLQDAEGYGYYAYKLDLGVPTTLTTTEEKNAWMDENYPYGTEVIMSAEATTYSGMLETNAGGILKKTGYTAQSRGIALDYKNATEAFAKAVAQTDTDTLNDYQNCKVVLNNCKLKSINGSYYYFTIGDSDVSFNVYDNVYFITAEEGNVWKERWVTGYTATIKGIVSVYSKAFQIYPDSTDCVTITDTTVDPNEMVNTVLEGLKGPTSLKANYLLTEKEGLTWAIETETTAAYIEEGKLVYVGGKEEETIKLVATYTYEGVSKNKEFEVKVAAKPEETSNVTIIPELFDDYGFDGYQNGEYTVGDYSYEFINVGTTYTYYQLPDQSALRYFQIKKLCSLTVKDVKAKKATVVLLSTYDFATDDKAVSFYHGDTLLSSLETAQYIQDNRVDSTSLNSGKTGWFYTLNFDLSANDTANFKVAPGNAAAYVASITFEMEEEAKVIEYIPELFDEFSLEGYQNDDFTVKGQTFTLDTVSVNNNYFTYPDSSLLRYFQIKKLKSLTLKELKATKVVVKLLSTYDYARDNYAVTYFYGGESITSVETVEAINAARVDSGTTNNSKTGWEYTLTFDLTGKDIADFQLLAGSSAAYVESITVYQ